MRTQRQVIDYALAKRALLADLFSGRASALEVCDAHPYLLRAAKYHGEPTDRTCPVCKREPMTQVTYVYGDELKQSSGHVWSTAQLATLEREYQELGVYVVEVCKICGWNHLHTSFVIGRQVPARRRAQGR